MRLTTYDPAEDLADPTLQAELISEALETGDAKVIAHAIGTVARARGMSQISKDSGVTREALYRALSAEGDPRLSTLTQVLSALGITLHATVKPAGV